MAKYKRCYRAFVEDGNKVSLESYSVASGVKIYHWEIDLGETKDIPFVIEALEDLRYDNN